MLNKTTDKPTTGSEVKSFEEFLSEHRLKVSRMLNKVLWALIVTGPLVLVAVLVGIFKNVSIFAAPIIAVVLFLVAFIHKKLIEKRANVVLTSIIAFVAIDALLVFMDSSHLAIYITWFMIPLLSLFFCDYKIYYLALGINYVFMAASVWLTAPYYVERRIDIETNLAYFLSRTGNFTAEMIAMAAAGFFLCRLSINNYKDVFDNQKKLYENQKMLYEKQELLYNNEKRIKEQMDIMASMSDIYDYVALIDPDTMQETELSRRTDDSGAESAEKSKFSLTGGELMQNISDEYADAFRAFVKLSDVRERLADKTDISEEVADLDECWYRVQFIAVNRSDGDTASEIIYTVQNIDSEKKEQDRLSEAAKTLNLRISSIANIFMTVHELDIASNTVTEIKSQSRVVNDVLSAVHTDPQGMLSQVMETVTDESSIAEVRRFIDLSTLGKRLKNTDTIAVEYLNKQKLWRRGRFVASRRDEKGNLTRILWLSEDIDNERRERDKLIDMSERALAASEAKSSFLSNMSHEIRTPINAVLGMNEMILRECDDSNILAYSNSIRTAGSTLLGLVNDILDFSKIEAGKMEIIPVDYDLSSVINDLVNMIQTKADDKGLKLELDISKTVPKQLHGDEVRIKQVITNILTNAVKYTEKGTVTFCIRYEKIPDEPDYVTLKVIVKDTGIGIKKEDMKKLFSEFERIDEERNRNVEGTGLGMNITKRLLEMMGTSLTAESIYGLGSKFSFDLKQRVVKWEELGDYEAAYKASLGKRRKYREKFRAPTAEVLVVDDTPMNLVVFRSLLKQTGVKIDTANSGAEGLSLAYDKKYDMIFLDHMMPEKDGIETLHEMRAQEKNPNLKTPTICLTANAISGAREQYLSAGFDDYLTKPIDSAKLEAMLIEYLPKEKILKADENAAEENPERADSESVIPKFVTEISEIDTATGIKNCGGEEAYFETLKTYAGMIMDHTDQIQHYWETGDLENATIKIHAMKSTSRIIGATDIGELAQELELAGKAKDTEKLGAHIDELLSRCRALGELLSPLVEKPPEEDDSDKPPISEDELKEAYGLIGEALMSAQIDNINEIAESFKTYRIPDAQKERVRNIIAAVENLDYDKLPEILE